MQKPKESSPGSHGYNMDNHGLFDILPNFPFTASETKLDYLKKL